MRIYILCIYIQKYNKKKYQEQDQEKMNVYVSEIKMYICNQKILQAILIYMFVLT